MYIPDNWDNIDNWGQLLKTGWPIWVNIKFKENFTEASL
jgi:hypothetical protein